MLEMIDFEILSPTVFVPSQSDQRFKSYRSFSILLIFHLRDMFLLQMGHMTPFHNISKDFVIDP